MFASLFGLHATDWKAEAFSDRLGYGTQGDAFFVDSMVSRAAFRLVERHAKRPGGVVEMAGRPAGLSIPDIGRMSAGAGHVDKIAHQALPPRIVDLRQALDSEVEQAIQTSLEGLMQDRTVVAIAHRLSTIAAMDRLVILDKGRIVEQGTHAELPALGGHYAGLWARQSGGFLEPEGCEREVPPLSCRTSPHKGETG